jgi:hypothetical protein
MKFCFILQGDGLLKEFYLSIDTKKHVAATLSTARQISDIASLRKRLSNIFTSLDSTESNETTKKKSISLPSKA